MIQISFTDEEISQLDYERRNHPHPRIRDKMEVVYLRAMGLPHKEIGRLCTISPTTLRRYLTTYKEEGLDGLKVFCVQKPRSEMHTYKTSIEEEFRKRPPATVPEAAARIEELTGLKRSEKQVRLFLRHLGMKPLKVASIPAKADPQEQEEFYKKNWIRP